VEVQFAAFLANLTVPFDYSIPYDLGVQLARLEGRMALEAFLFECLHKSGKIATFMLTSRIKELWQSTCRKGGESRD